MQSRRYLKENPPKPNRKKKRSLAQSSKKDMTGKQKKRLSALKELMDMDEGESPAASVADDVAGENAENAADGEGAAAVEDKSKGGAADDVDGIFGKIKGFYKQADSMAASQALLLNKELEDRGVVEKITDESGLKVIGKEAARAAKQQDDDR